MISLILTLLSGMLAGRLLARRLPSLHGVASRALMPVLLVLLFFMGVALGANRAIVCNLYGLGLEALIITLGASTGTIVFASLLWRCLPKGAAMRHEATEVVTDGLGAERSSSLGASLRGVVRIVAMLAAGVVAGRCAMMSEAWASRASVAVLYALLAVVGLYVGSGRELAEGLRRQSAWVLLVPLATLVGTLVGAALMAPLVAGRSPAQCLAVASGFGYYSLSAILISEYCGADLGLVALLANILRELLVLLLAPLLVRLFNPLTPICLGGATSMDSTLPSIVSASGPGYLLIALMHGIIVDASVPLLVTLFVG